MNRGKQLFFVFVVAAALPASARAQTGIQYDKIEIKTDKVAPNLYMLSGSEGVDPGHPDGAGGRIGVLAGPDGIFMVDSQYLQIGDKVLAAIRRIDPGPIRFLVNTHIHGDHTAGNATFAKLGAVLLAREELREGMMRQPATTTTPAPARDPARLPVVTYGMGDPVRFRMNGETVELIPVRAAHTGGDTMVRFVNADVIMIGDFYRNFGYPFIDTSNGGSLKGALEGLELTMKMSGPATRHPGPRHLHQSDRHHSLSRHDSRRAGQSAAADRAGQDATGRPGREGDVSLRCEGAGWTLAGGRGGDERRPVCQHGVFAVEGKSVVPESRSRTLCVLLTSRRLKTRAGRCPGCRSRHIPTRRRASRRRSPLPARSAIRHAPALR